MWYTNRGAAVLIVAVLAPIAVYIVLSDWAVQRVSDGFRLGTFPLVYVVLAIGLIGVTVFDEHHAERLAHLDEFSMRGLFRIAAFIAAALVLAFVQERIGFVPCACILAVTAAVAMGQRSLLGLVVFSIGSSIVLFAVFYALGISIAAGPNF